MTDITMYVLVDEHGNDAGCEHADAQKVRDDARTLAGRHALVGRVYEYTHEYSVEIPEGAAEWPPSEEAQEASGRLFMA